jgi:phosphatidylglycerol:prolipoprotein diacylglycerol transferase
VQPELLKFGTFVIPGFMAMVAIGAMLALGIGFHLARQRGLDRMELLSYSIFMALSFWLGAVLYRLFFTFLQSPQAVIENLFHLRVLIEKSGTSVVGGILGAALFSWLYLKRVGLPLWGTLDITFTAIPLAQAVGRIGCFLGGCCYGRPTDMFWGVTFPGHSHAVHPTQLYESFLNLLNFVVLLIVYRKRKFEGQVFSLYLINYALIRIVVEFWRGDTHRGFVIRGASPWTSLSIPQMMCLVILSLGVLVYLRRRKKSQA